MSAVSEATVSAKLGGLTDRQDSIQAVSAWFQQHMGDADLLAATWLDVLVDAPHSQKLPLVYLANEVLQVSRRKGGEFAPAFHSVLPAAIVHCMFACEPKVRKAVARVIGIWRERRIFSDEFLDGLVSSAQPSAENSAAASDAESAASARQPTATPPPARRSSNVTERPQGPRLVEVEMQVEEILKAEESDKAPLQRARELPRICLDPATLLTITDRRQAVERQQTVGDAIRLLAECNGRLVARSEDCAALLKSISSLISYNLQQVRHDSRFLEDSMTMMARAQAACKVLRRKWPELPENKFSLKPPDTAEPPAKRANNGQGDSQADGSSVSSLSSGASNTPFISQRPPVPPPLPPPSPPPPPPPPPPQQPQDRLYSPIQGNAYAMNARPFPPYPRPPYAHPGFRPRPGVVSYSEGAVPIAPYHPRTPYFRPWSPHGPQRPYMQAYPMHHNAYAPQPNLRGYARPLLPEPNGNVTGALPLQPSPARQPFFQRAPMAFRSPYSPREPDFQGSPTRPPFPPPPPLSQAAAPRSSSPPPPPPPPPPQPHPPT